MSKKYVFAACLALSGQLALAQQQDSLRQEETLKEVVITASKVPLTQRETAKPVQVISRDEIDRSLGKDLSQVLNEQAGILINGAYSGPSATKGLYVRGASSAYTLILIDGVPLTDAAGLGGAFDLRMLPLDQIERIEILKGSQSTLYGSDAIAGVINIITRTAGRKPLSISGALSLGSLNTSEAAIGVNGTLDIFEYSLNYSRFFSEGFSEAKDTVKLTEFDKDGVLRETFQAKAGVRIGESLRITPFLRYSEYEGGYDGGSFSDAANTYSAYLLNPGLTGTYDLGALSLTALYNYIKLDRVNQSAWRTTFIKGRTHNTDIYASYKLNPNVQLLTGLYYQKAQMLDTLATERNPSFDTISPYVTFLIKDLSGINLEVGYRFNDHADFGTHSTYSIAPSYTIVEGVQIYGSYATGFKSPVLSQLFGQWGANPDLKPETSTTWEGGVSLNLLQNKLEASATYFDRKIQNVIFYDGASGYINQDKQEDHGIELEVGYRPSNKLSLSANYTYVDGAFTTKLSKANKEGVIINYDSTYYNLVRRPRHSFGATLGFRPVDVLYISLNGQHYGDRFDYAFHPVTYARENVDLQSYFLLNAYAEYKLIDDRLTIFADLKNITNTDFTEVYGYSTIGFNLQSGVRFRL